VKFRQSNTNLVYEYNEIPLFLKEKLQVWAQKAVIRLFINPFLLKEKNTVSSINKF
jgi:hypothetical protein